MRQMPLTLLLSGALLPSALPRDVVHELAGALQAPVLSRWLQRAAALADRPVIATTGDAAWLAEHVFGLQDPAHAPVAPYAWAELTGETTAGTGVWMAEAVHVAVGRDSLMVQPLPEPLDHSAADALIAAANECLVDSDARLQRSGTQWFLHTDRPWALESPPLDAMLGEPFTLPDVQDAPDGSAARQWSRLHNAIQMNWHRHPVNIDREAQGAPAVSALWLQGGGCWKQLRPLRWPHVSSAAAALRGAARAAGATVSTPADGWTGEALVDLPHALAAARIGDWRSWLEAMAALDREMARVPAGRAIELVLTARDRVRTWRVEPADRLRFWRRNALASALSAGAA